jgi:hypothetical protein
VAVTDEVAPQGEIGAVSRDDFNIARAFLGTPLETDPGTGKLRPGQCTSWEGRNGARRWIFRCRDARHIADNLRRAAFVGGSPGAMLLRFASSIAARDERTLDIRLRGPWLRFPYVLTSAAAAAGPGPFEYISGSPERIVGRRGKLRLEFVRMNPRAAVRAFRRGLVDEAPVPPGEVKAFSRSHVRVRSVLGLDLVTFMLGTWQRPHVPFMLRRTFAQTVLRPEYALLTGAAAPAFGLVPGAAAPEWLRPAAVRRARRQIEGLPRRRMALLVPRGSGLLDEAELAVAHWRDAGLAAAVATPAHGRGFNAQFVRLLAPYPQPEALLAALLLSSHDSPWATADSRARRLLLRALAVRDQRRALATVDAALQEASAVVPLARLADARLVSPRLRGWRRDALGVVDYARIRLR